MVGKKINKKDHQQTYQAMMAGINPGGPMGSQLAGLGGHPGGMFKMPNGP